jgi:hypothetical protein
MKFKLAAAAALLIVAERSSAHRVDEYLQATLFSIEPTGIHAEVRLSPGIAVLPIVFAVIDGDSDGVISAKEWGAYAQQVVRDLELSVDGAPQRLRLTSSRFPSAEDMLGGRGEILLEIEAPPAVGGSQHRLLFESHHQTRIGAYLVNCLVSRDPTIDIGAQTRNYSQSRYELAFTQRGGAPRAAGLPQWFVVVLMGFLVIALGVVRLVRSRR